MCLVGFVLKPCYQSWMNEYSSQKGINLGRAEMQGSNNNIYL